MAGWAKFPEQLLYTSREKQIYVLTLSLKVIKELSKGKGRKCSDSHFHNDFKSNTSLIRYI